MGRLLDSTWTRLHRSITDRLKRRMMQDRVPDSDCEDCVQQVWLALLEVHPEWALGEPRTMAWLLAVAHNKAMDFRRQLSRHGSRSIDELHSPPVTDPPREIEEEVVPGGRDQALISGLQDALTQVTDLNRQIFARRVQGDTYRQIGDDAGLPPDQVRARYHRVLRKVRGGIASLRARLDVGGGGTPPSLAKRLPCRSAGLVSTFRSGASASFHDGMTFVKSRRKQSELRQRPRHRRFFLCFL